VSFRLKSQEKCATINRKMDYFLNETADFSFAKDLKVYNCSNWFKKIFINLNEQLNYQASKVLKKEYSGVILNGFLLLIRDGIIYYYVIFSVVNGTLAAADFVFYFGIATGISFWFNGLIKSTTELGGMAKSIGNFREFMDEKFARNEGEGVDIYRNKTYSICFKDVSYIYPKAKFPTFDKFNLNIKRGEKVALVGVNGAGKTTLVKLLTGLYKPSSGIIEMGSVSSNEYNYLDYFKLFSVVFQDFNELPFSIKENITMGNKITNDDLNEILKKSDMTSFIESLPNGVETLLVKKIHNNGIDLSGGEKQKLQLAKAIYKDGAILILDEPTAALDPLSEEKIYRMYNDLCKDKTALFISHRLASTMFCDRILLLENGKIVEEGSHDELIKLKGKYYKMFKAQSNYYKEEVVENEIS